MSNIVIVALSSSHITGKGIVLFTMFYCGLNWMYYKSLQEKEGDDDDDKGDGNAKLVAIPVEQQTKQM